MEDLRLQSLDSSNVSCKTPAQSWFSVALRPQRRDGLLGTGTEWEGGERVINLLKAHK